MPFAQLFFQQAPAPVSSRPSRRVHSCFRPQSQHILHWHNRQCSHRGVHRLDEGPLRFSLVITDLQERPRTPCLHPCHSIPSIPRCLSAPPPPPQRRVIVVRSRKRYQLALVVARTVGVVVVKPELQHRHSRHSKLTAERPPFRRDNSQVFRQKRHLSQLPSQRLKEFRARSFPPMSPARG